MVICQTIVQIARINQIKSQWAFLSKRIGYCVMRMASRCIYKRIFTQFMVSVGLMNVAFRLFFVVVHIIAFLTMYETGQQWIVALTVRNWTSKETKKIVHTLATCTSTIEQQQNPFCDASFTLFHAAMTSHLLHNNANGILNIIYDSQV